MQLLVQVANSINHVYVCSDPPRGINGTAVPGDSSLRHRTAPHRRQPLCVQHRRRGRIKSHNGIDNTPNKAAQVHAAESSTPPLTRAQAKRVPSPTNRRDLASIRGLQMILTSVASSHTREEVTRLAMACSRLPCTHQRHRGRPCCKRLISRTRVHRHTSRTRVHAMSARNQPSKVMMRQRQRLRLRLLRRSRLHTSQAQSRQEQRSIICAARASSRQGAWQSLPPVSTCTCMNHPCCLAALRWGVPAGGAHGQRAGGVVRGGGCAAKGSWDVPQARGSTTQ